MVHRIISHGLRRFVDVARFVVHSLCRCLLTTHPTKTYETAHNVYTAIGTGVLGLPGAMAALGWIAGCALLLGFAILVCFLTMLLSRTTVVKVRKPMAQKPMAVGASPPRLHPIHHATHRAAATRHITKQYTAPWARNTLRPQRLSNLHTFSHQVCTYSCSTKPLEAPTKHLPSNQHRYCLHHCPGDQLAND